MLRSFARKGQTFRLSRPRFLRFASSDAVPPNQYTARRERWVTPTILFIGFIPVLSFGLGTWQIQRLQWKINLIDELEEKLHMEPLSLPKQINLDTLPEFIFRKVLLTGQWDHEHTMLLGPRVRDGVNGYHVVTPLVRADGSTVIVDRGFIPKDNVDLERRSRTQDTVQVLGLLRTTHTRNNFTPINLPDAGVWYWVDLDAMAEYAGGTKAGVQPVYVEEVFVGNPAKASERIRDGIPVGRPPAVDLRNAHLSYVITWYSLSAVTAAMFIRLLLKRRASPTKPLPR